jgi:hypothetical protein
MSSPVVDLNANETRGRRFFSFRVLVALAVAIFLTFALYWHCLYLNDTAYFMWGWHHLPERRLYPVALLAAPFFVGQWVFHRWPGAIGIALSLVMLSVFLLTVGYTVVQAEPPSLSRTVQLIDSPIDNGYMGAAIELVTQKQTVRQILGNYPHVMSAARGHATNKPPGPILFNYALLRLFGMSYGAALFSGLLIAMGTALSAGASFAFIAYFTGNRDAAFYGASFVALCPGPLLMYPQFDQCFPLFTAALTITWAQSLKKNSILLAALFGGLYAATLFVTYLPAVLVIFFAGFAWLKWRADRTIGLSQILTMGGVAVAVFFGSYLLLWMLTGFDPIETFKTALAMLRTADFSLYLGGTRRPDMPGIIFWDLYCFALGAGWISYLLAAYYFASAGKSTQFRIAILCVAQFVLVGLFGWVRAETWRTWMCMLPMLMLPVGLELGKWNIRARLAVYGALLMLTTVLCQSLQLMF